MKTKHIHQKDFAVFGIIILIFFVLVLSIFSWYNNKEPRSELYEKSVRQIEYYKTHISEPIYISNEMCEHLQEKGIGCSWSKDTPYYYSSSFYDDKKQSWYLLLQKNLTDEPKRISTESVRITNNKIFDNSYVTHIDDEKVETSNPDVKFIKNRPYFYISLDTLHKKILVLDYTGNQVFLPSSIRIPTPPKME